MEYKMATRAAKVLLLVLCIGTCVRTYGGNQTYLDTGVFVSCQNKFLLLFRNNTYQVEWELMTGYISIDALRSNKRDYEARLTYTNNPEIVHNLGSILKARFLKAGIDNVYEYSISFDNDMPEIYRYKKIK